MSNPIALFGYSDHGLVAADLIDLMGRSIGGYCEPKEKKYNPYQFSYLGYEEDPHVIERISTWDYFISIGDNHIRRKLTERLKLLLLKAPVSAIHPNAYISSRASVSDNGVLVGSHCTINACSIIGEGVICNTNAVIEHECVIAPFAHIAPSATLCGNVKIGECSFIGANSVVKQGVRIGSNVIVGAGTVVIKDIPDHSKVVGNPSRTI